MARVLVKRLPWGTLWEKDPTTRVLKAPLAGQAASLSTTVYSGATGDTEVTSFVTDSNGDLPGWVEEGSHTLTVNGVATQVEAISGNTKANLPVNLADHGTLTTDGTGDNTAAINAAIAATPVGGTLVVPEGHFRHTSTINVNKSMNIRMEGPGSAFKPDVGTTVDAWVFEPASGTTYLYNLDLDLNIIGGANSCRSGVRLTNVLHAKGRIRVRTGTAATGWGIDLNGIELCDLGITVNGGNVTYPYTGSAPANGCRVRNGNLNWPSNANRLWVLIEALSGDGFSMDSTGSPQGNNWVSGTVQGITGRGIYLKDCADFSLRDLHIEASTAGIAAGENKLVLQNCGHGQVGGGVIVVAHMEVTGCTDLKLDGLYCDKVTIDSASEVRVGEVNYASNGGAWTDNSAHTVYEGYLVKTGAKNSSRAGPGVDDAHNLLANGDLQHWDAAGAPLGDIYTTAGTITKTGTGQADTRKLGGDYAGLMAGLNAQVNGRASLNTPAWVSERLAGRYVTSSVWVYIPSGQATTPVVEVRHSMSGGAQIYTGESSSRVDAWHQVSITSLVPAGATSIDVQVRNTAAATGNWYVAQFAMNGGRVAPLSQAPRVPPRRSASMTYDPPSLADNAADYPAAMTVQGAQVGDPVLVSFTGSPASQVGVIFSGVVTAANTVRATILNKSGAAVDLASGTLRVEVLPL